MHKYKHYTTLGAFFMGAMVIVKVDKAKVDSESSQSLALALKPIVAQAIEDDDVFVYVDQPSFVYAADPIEIFIQLNSQKTPDPEAATEKIANSIGAWKKSVDYPHTLNINITPVYWCSKTGI